MSKLFHITARSRLSLIMTEGLEARSCFLHEDQEALRRYYEEEVELNGEEPVCLEVDLDDLQHADLAPDMPSIEEPITLAIGQSEEEVWEAWQESSQDWRASLEIVGSIRCDSVVSPAIIRFPEEPEMSQDRCSILP